MRPKFISIVYFEGRLLAFEEWGDVYHSLTWVVLAYSPCPSKDDPYTPIAKVEP